MNRFVLGFDIGSTSIGSAWIDLQTGEIVTGVSVFPSGVEELDESRGDPKNLKRKLARHARLALARRSSRMRLLHARLLQHGLLPSSESEFIDLVQKTNPWELRARGLHEPLTPVEFGRVLLHLARRRGVRIRDSAENLEKSASASEAEEGRQRMGIRAARKRMRELGVPTFGALMARMREERVVSIESEDLRRPDRRKGPREYRDPIRNRGGTYEHIADRNMIREEFGLLWEAQKRLSPELREILTDELRLALDDEEGDAAWVNKGLLFGQRRPSWDAGVLGRCTLHPTDRLIAYADRHASRFRVVEAVNALRIQEAGKPERPLTPGERRAILGFLSGPLGTAATAPHKGARQGTRRKVSVGINDLRSFMGWGRANERSRFRFNIESNPDRSIPTDWFQREIVHRGVTLERWKEMTETERENLNRVILRFDPGEPGHGQRLRNAVRKTAGFTEDQVERIVEAWEGRPRLDKRLPLSRRAVRNLLEVMDQSQPWVDVREAVGYRWLTPGEARLRIAEDPHFVDRTSGLPLDSATRERYFTGARTDHRHSRRRVLMDDGKPLLSPEGEMIPEPSPAPVISNPVVRRSVHELRRHLIAHLRRARRLPDQVVVELSRDSRYGKERADRLLILTRRRDRIWRSVISEIRLEDLPTAQRRTAVARVLLAVQQGGHCPLCGEAGLTEQVAAKGADCTITHIIPVAEGGHGGFSNTMLVHAGCGRKQGRRLPREVWAESIGVDEGLRVVESIYARERIPQGKIRSATGPELWLTYFERSDDLRKIEQFKRDRGELGDASNRNAPVPNYATRQILAYLSDALFEGREGPEAGGEVGHPSREVAFTDRMWTARLRYEWGVVFEPHRRTGEETPEEENARKEKTRGDHRQRALNAVVIALTDPSVRAKWEEREREADLSGVNAADEESIREWRRMHPIARPGIFQYWSREAFRDRVRRSVYGEGRADAGRPVAHRPTKRKLVGALHEETLFGPVVDEHGGLTGLFTGRKPVESLTPNHLRLPVQEDSAYAVNRLAARRQKEGETRTDARRWARNFVKGAGYTPLFIDPPPGSSGLVRDLALRMRIRECLEAAGVDPDSFRPAEIQKVVQNGGIAHRSGVPIRSVILLRTMDDPAVIPRKKRDYATGRIVLDEGSLPRAYQSGNNHHIELRIDDLGRWEWEVVSAFEASHRNTARLRTLREAGIPNSDEMRKLTRAERRSMQGLIAEIERRYPIVDRRDDPERGLHFVMSLSEGEMVFAKHPKTGIPGYFVVVKLKKDGRIYLAPHWDARSASGRKDEWDRSVSGSTRETVDIRPARFSELAPSPTLPHVTKIRVDPLGRMTILKGD